MTSSSFLIKTFKCYLHLLFNTYEGIKYSEVNPCRQFRTRVDTASKWCKKRAAQAASRDVRVSPDVRHSRGHRRGHGDAWIARPPGAAERSAVPTPPRTATLITFDIRRKLNRLAIGRFAFHRLDRPLGLLSDDLCSSN